MHPNVSLPASCALVKENSDLLQPYAVIYFAVNLQLSMSSGLSMFITENKISSQKLGMDLI